MSLPELLQKATDFIIQHKEHLDDSTHDQLSRTFRQARLSPQDIQETQKPQTLKRLRNPKTSEKPRKSKNPRQSTASQEFVNQIQRARKSISQKRRIDIIPSKDLLSLIEDLDASPIQFWNVVQMGSSWDCNLIRYFYHRNRQVNTTSLIYRAFSTTATFLLVRGICREFKVTNFTSRVEAYCANLIMDTSDATDEEARKQVNENVRADFKIGKIWYRYAEHLGGYGAFFLMGVATISWYEDTMKNHDNVDYVASHFKTIEMPELATQYRLHELGLRIMKSILPDAENPGLPDTINPDLPQPARNNLTASGSSPPRTGYVPSSNSSRISSGCAQLDRDSASPTQDSFTRHETDQPSRKRARHHQTTTSKGRDDRYQWVVDTPRRSFLAASPHDASSSHGLTLSQIAGHQQPASETQNPVDYRPSTTQELPEQQPGRQTAGRNDQHQRSTHQAQGSHSTGLTPEPVEDLASSAQQTSTTNPQQRTRPILHPEENIGATSDTPHGIYHSSVKNANPLALEEPVQASLVASSTGAPTEPSSTLRPYDTITPHSQRQGRDGRRCSYFTRVNAHPYPTIQQPLSQASFINADDANSYPGSQIPYSLGDWDQEYNYGPDWDYCYMNMGPDLPTDASISAGNWDFEYSAISQPAQTRFLTPFLWGNWDYTYGHIKPDLPINTPFCAGNWDLEYNTASQPTQTAIPVPNFYGDGEHGIEANLPSNILPLVGNRNFVRDAGLRPMPEVSVPLVRSY